MPGKKGGGASAKSNKITGTPPSGKRPVGLEKTGAPDEQIMLNKTEGPADIHAAGGGAGGGGGPRVGRRGWDKGGKETPENLGEQQNIVAGTPGEVGGLADQIHYGTGDQKTEKSKISAEGTHQEIDKEGTEGKQVEIKDQTQEIPDLGETPANTEVAPKKTAEGITATPEHLKNEQRVQDYIGSLYDITPNQIRSALNDFYGVTEAEIEDWQDGYDFDPEKIRRIHAAIATQADLESAMLARDDVEADQLLQAAKDTLNGDLEYDIWQQKLVPAGEATTAEDIENAGEQSAVFRQSGEYEDETLEGSKEPTAEAAPIADIQEANPMEDSKNVLHQRVGNAAGSNPGGAYVGEDGVKRYVKFYDRSERSFNELVANNIYNALGIPAPKSTLIEHDGKLAVANEWVGEGKTLAQLSWDSGTYRTRTYGKEDSKKILDNFITDLWMVNFDAVGLVGDNVLKTSDGTIHRVDNGGALLFRARGKDKTDEELYGNLTADINQYIQGGPGGRGDESHSGYAGAFRSLGIQSANDPAFKKLVTPQIARLAELREKTNNFETLVPNVPGLNPALRAKMLKVLQTRAKMIIGG